MIYTLIIGPFLGAQEIFSNEKFLDGEPIFTPILNNTENVCIGFEFDSFLGLNKSVVICNSNIIDSIGILNNDTSVELLKHIRRLYLKNNSSIICIRSFFTQGDINTYAIATNKENYLSIINNLDGDSVNEFEKFLYNKIKDDDSGNLKNALIDTFISQALDCKHYLLVDKPISENDPNFTNYLREIVYG